MDLFKCSEKMTVHPSCLVFDQHPPLAYFAAQKHLSVVDQDVHCCLLIQ